MIEKNRIFGIIGIVMIILMMPLTLAYDNWTIGVTYQIDDIVTYNNTNYICVQAHTSQAGWTPPVVPALWNIFEEPPENGIWGVGIHYNVGDVVLYENNNISYEVRQEHTSQADWLPPNVLALYKPIYTEAIVGYTPKENNLTYQEYIDMNDEEIINFMDFQYLKGEYKENQIEYSWNFIAPEKNNNNEIKWIIKPIIINLEYKLINDCLNLYTEQECLNGLVLGTDIVTINDTNITSVVTKASNIAINEINYAITLKEELEYQLFSQNFIFNNLELNLNE